MEGRIARLASSSCLRRRCLVRRRCLLDVLVEVLEQLVESSLLEMEDSQECLPTTGSGVAVFFIALVNEGSLGEIASARHRLSRWWFRG
jgi:hypothetical protein